MGEAQPKVFPVPSVFGLALLEGRLQAGALQALADSAKKRLHVLSSGDVIRSAQLPWIQDLTRSRPHGRQVVLARLRSIKQVT